MIKELFNKSIISAFPFMQELSNDQRVHLLDNCRLNEISADSYLMNESIECSDFTLIISGVVRIFKLSPEGKEVTLYRIGRGEICVLTIACILGAGVIPYPVSAIAEKDTIMAVLPVGLFRKAFNEYEAVRMFIFSAMAAKFYAVLGLVEQLTFKRTSERLLELLITKTGGGAYPLYATHGFIASELGTAREVISRLLKEYEQKGMVKLQRGKVSLVSLKNNPL